jgi:hypothetical protein
MENQSQKLTLSRETLRTLEASPPEREVRENAKYPTTTVLTRFRTCTC